MASIQPKALGKVYGLILTAMMVSSFLYIRNGEMLHTIVIFVDEQEAHKCKFVTFCCSVWWALSQINEGESMCKFCLLHLPVF